MSSDALSPDDSPDAPGADASPGDGRGMTPPQLDGEPGKDRAGSRVESEAAGQDAGAPDFAPADELAKAPVAPEVDRDTLLAAPSTECLNCGRDLPGLYCPGCGQKAERLRQPVHHYLRDSAQEFFGIDGRIWRTFGALLFKPGTLTREYLAGRRQRYLRPLRVYLVATLGFFFLLSLIDPVGRAREELFDSDMLTDSVRVADEYARIDSLLSLGDGALDDERAAVAAARRQLDSLGAQPDTAAEASELDDAADELEEALDDLRRDSLQLVEEAPRREVERAVLAVLPPDSVIVLDGVRGTANLIYPDSSSFFGDGSGDDWLIRNQALRSMSGAATEAQRREGLVQFVRSVIGYVPTVLFLILPVFALVLKVLYIRRGWYYSEHLIFGLHTHAFAFAVFGLVTLLTFASTAVDEGLAREALGWMAVGLLGAIPVYFFVAQKRLYGQGWVKTALKALVLAFTYNIVLFAGLLAVLFMAALFG